MGAGVAHLTLMLASKEFQIAAVEPNDAMRLMVPKEQKSLVMFNGMRHW